MIDRLMIEKENNRAEKQCQDDHQAYTSYKKKILFPNKSKMSKEEI